MLVALADSPEQLLGKDELMARVWPGVVVEDNNITVQVSALRIAGEGFPVSRDAAVIAYQTGAGLMDMITPTNGALLAILLGAKVSYGRWIRFAIPGALLVSLVGFVGIWLAGS